MPSIKPTQDNSVYISDTFEQGNNESDWTSYTPSYKGIGPAYVIESETTNTNLVTIGGREPTEGDPVLVKDGTDPSIVKGTLGTVEKTIVNKAFEQVVYSGVMFDFSGTEGSPFSVAFNDTGNKMYMAGGDTDTVYQYSLSTAFDVSTASGPVSSFSVSNQSNSPYDISFSSDGTLMHILNNSSDTLFQYDLGTPFEVATASYNSVSIPLDRANWPWGHTFNNNGLKLYYVDNTANAIFQYSLGAPFDIGQAASYDNVSLDVSSQDGTPSDIAFNQDGTKLYMLGRDADTVFQYSLTTAFDLSTATYDNLSFSVGNEESSPYGMTVVDNDSKMLITGAASNAVHEYILSEPRYDTDITSLELSAPPTVVCRDSLPRMFTSYELDPSQCLAQDVTLSFVSSSTSQYATDFTSTVTNLLASGSPVIPFEGRLPTPIDRSNFEASYSFSPDWEAESAEFSPDGTILFVVGKRSHRVMQFTLSTPFDITTATYQHVTNTHVDVYDQDQTPSDATFNNDGTKMYVGGADNVTIFQYSLSVAYDLATASYDNVSFNVNGKSLEFSNDGTRLFASGGSGAALRQYSLSTAFDLSTASIGTLVNFNAVASTTATPDEITLTNEKATKATSRAFTFNNDGTKIYVASEDAIYSSSAELLPGSTSSGMAYGEDVAVDGTRVIVGTEFGTTSAGNSGSVYVYNFNGTTYDLVQFIEPAAAERFGVGLAADADRLIVGAPSADPSAISSAGRAYIYDWNGSSYGLTGEVNVSDPSVSAYFGQSADLDGTRLVIGAMETSVGGADRAGKVYIYEWNGSSYDEVATLTGSVLNQRFGKSVAISGNRLLVGSDSATSVGVALYIYDWNGSTYDLVNTIEQPNDNNGSGFASSLALDNNRLFVGMQLASKYSNIANGLVYIYEPDGTTYRQLRAFAPDAQFNEFGASVAADGTRVAVGAPVNDDNVLNTGKVYVYDIPLGITVDTPWTGNVEGPVIDQYLVETAFDISTVVYEKSFSVASQDDTRLLSLTFNNDGTSIYAMGDQFTQVGDLFRYTLSTPYDIGTATYDSKLIIVSLEEVRRLLFNNTGTMAYALSQYDSQIRTYTLSTPYDVSTMVWTGDSVNLDVFTYLFDDNGTPTVYTGVYPTDMAFNNDGSKFYLLDSFGSPLHQFTLSTPYDVTTLTYDSVEYTFSEANSPYNFAFADNGSKIILVDESSSLLRQYSLATPFDISTTTYNNVTFNTSIDSSSALDFAFNTNGTLMFTLVFNFNQASRRIHQYSLSTPFDISTATYDNVFYDLEGYDPEEPRSGSGLYLFHYLLFNDNKSKFYVGSVYNDVTIVHQFTIPDNVDGNLPLIKQPNVNLTSNPTLVVTEFSVDRFSYTGTSFSVSTQDGTPVGVSFNNTGTKMFMIGVNTDHVYQYSLTTGFDLSTASYDSVSFSLAGQTTGPEGFSFNADGTKMYSIDYNGPINQYTLTTAFDLSDVSYDGISFDASAQETGCGTLTFNNDGTKMYVAGYETSRIYQYALTTAFDVSTAAYETFIPTYQQDPEIQSLAFNDDGTVLFALGTFNSRIYQYSLSTAFDISTARYNYKSLTTTDTEFSPTGIALVDNNTKLFITGTGDDIHEYLVNTSLTLDFATLGFEPGQLAIPDRSVEHVTVDSEQWVDSYIQTTYTEVVDDGRGIIYKFVADDGQEIIEARYDLTKLAPGIRDI